MAPPEYIPINPRFSSAGDALTAAMVLSKVGATDTVRLMNANRSRARDQHRAERLVELVKRQFVATERALQASAPKPSTQQALNNYIASANPMWQAANYAYLVPLQRIGDRLSPKFVQPAVFFSHAALAVANAGREDLDASCDSFVSAIRALEGLRGDGVGDEAAAAVLAGRKSVASSGGVYLQVSSAHLGAALLTLGAEAIAHSGRISTEEEGRISLAVEFLLEAERLRDAFTGARRP